VSADWAGSSRLSFALLHTYVGSMLFCWSTDRRYTNGSVLSDGVRVVYGIS